MGCACGVVRWGFGVGGALGCALILRGWRWVALSGLRLGLCAGPPGLAVRWAFGVGCALILRGWRWVALSGLRLGLCVCGFGSATHVPLDATHVPLDAGLGRQNCVKWDMRAGMGPSMASVSPLFRASELSACISETRTHPRVTTSPLCLSRSGFQVAHRAPVRHADGGSRRRGRDCADACGCGCGCGCRGCSTGDAGLDGNRTTGGGCGA
jgi:hypothetical protein